MAGDRLMGISDEPFRIKIRGNIEMIMQSIVTFVP
jgi:hypothetical protein